VSVLTDCLNMTELFDAGDELEVDFENGVLWQRSAATPASLSARGNGRAGGTVEILFLSGDFWFDPGSESLHLMSAFGPPSANERSPADHRVACQQQCAPPKFGSPEPCSSSSCNFAFAFPSGGSKSVLFKVPVN
jgi:hypothetical protein